MKTFLKVIGILIVIYSSIYILYTASILSSLKSMGHSEYGYLIMIPITMLIIGIILIRKSSDKKKSDKDYKEYKRYKEQREKIYYNHKDYECKRYDEYLMSPQERLNKIYSELPTTEQKKIVQYAESVYKRHESERYR